MMGRVSRPAGIALLVACSGFCSLIYQVVWERTLRYNYPEPAVRSLRWLAVHTSHEVQHHLGDIRGQVDRPNRPQI